MDKGMGKGFLMGQGPADGATLTGGIKSINAEKGYGFVVSGDLQADLYFKLDPATAAMAPGQQVSFVLRWMRDGKAQAHDLAPALSHGDVVAGCVRMYNDAKGFGFVSSEQTRQDIYFNKAVLPADRQAASAAELIACQVQVSVKLTNDGKPQAQDLALLSGPDFSMLESLKRSREAASDGSADGSAAKRPRQDGFNGGMAAGWGGAAAAVAPALVGKGAGGWESSAPEGATCTGTVRTYNAAKGFGFIGSPNVTTGDVYFKGDKVPPHLQGVPLEGHQVQFLVRYTPDGKAQAAQMQM
uniref:CSD domain-containing protein n=1 Tax=Zooxanthella nutricula TaxID=1333877 RepID=A0A7S2NUC7_9DINO|mmetsp:Transcript_38447/g.116269  ORF Transcript_38447/g.116269 Transcript_38447/m.116269 type:complete len:299 (+) Transcript_38447:1-897(+)